ncbi:glucose-6-phosphate dehydrogenase [Rhizobium jaguaris]|uniref:Glucose-6-phosphate 1-dehydrogenase n=2 Tax=Rhizobium jaguaris TaxID=1312183 RepID=A0A387FIX6_9HYPH|nr:glucose-6-phosphate dehydrogenase [Rhizobium jaguaris]
MHDRLHRSPAPPLTLVIFGATGDLTRRLLMPTLINMTKAGMLGDDLHVLGVSIEPGGDEFLVERLDTFLAANGMEQAQQSDAWQRLKTRISYISGDFTQGAIYQEISRRLQQAPSANAAFYFAVQPRFFGDITSRLAEHGLLDETAGVFRRIAIEKPFGHDLASAQMLNATLLHSAEESQVYRIDHFLGKETVQNIMTTRFANMMIEALWNNNYVDHVQITAAEFVDVGTRGKFYDATGALRDMVPNHLFQLLAMVAMEPPNSFDAESVRNEKGKVLKALRHYSRDEAAKNAVRGAYTAGPLDGKDLPAYTETPDVAPDSNTETYVALKLFVDTWRWAGVPFYLRTGKALRARDTEVVITFRQVPFAQFPRAPSRPDLPPNKLIIQVQPNEGLQMGISIKSPGLVLKTAPIELDFRYADHFDIGHQTGYESLLYELFLGDQTLFQRADSIEAGWAAVQPFLDLFADGAKPDPYAPGSMGPACADELIGRDGRVWHKIGDD